MLQLLKPKPIELSTRKLDALAPSVSGPLPTSVHPVSESMMIRQSIPVGSMSPATVKMEPNTIPSSNFPHPPSVSHGPYQGITSLQSSPPSSTSQDMITNNDNVQEFKPVVGGLSQPMEWHQLLCLLRKMEPYMGRDKDNLCLSLNSKDTGLHQHQRHVLQFFTRMSNDDREVVLAA
ncbi:hypothetical protein MKW98_002485 [Papaver atlanticum]|uniref:Uncharacterized protein n=1 Tax=Papaver atlanticum TaxID=357466 RepID=A0AAD4XB40_9MAGN|nr:hypothetical protein MKW98_002485 [Papaver atlanticum]